MGENLKPTEIWVLHLKPVIPDSGTPNSWTLSSQSAQKEHLSVESQRPSVKSQKVRPQMDYTRVTDFNPQQGTKGRKATCSLTEDSPRQKEHRTRELHRPPPDKGCCSLEMCALRQEDYCKSEVSLHRNREGKKTACWSLEGC